MCAYLGLEGPFLVRLQHAYILGVQEGEHEGDKVPGREETHICQQARWLLLWLISVWHSKVGLVPIGSIR